MALSATSLTVRTSSGEGLIFPAFAFSLRCCKFFAGIARILSCSDPDIGRTRSPVVPGMDIISSPSANAHARTVCPAVASYFLLISVRPFVSLKVLRKSSRRNSRRVYGSLRPQGSREMSRETFHGRFAMIDSRSSW